jgi:hypothetical protein
VRLPVLLVDIVDVVGATSGRSKSRASFFEVGEDALLCGHPVIMDFDKIVLLAKNIDELAGGFPGTRCSRCRAGAGGNAIHAAGKGEEPSAWAARCSISVRGR